jgi:hypothetical protein
VAERLALASSLKLSSKSEHKAAETHLVWVFAFLDIAY